MHLVKVKELHGLLQTVDMERLKSLLLARGSSTSPDHDHTLPLLQVHVAVQAAVYIMSVLMQGSWFTATVVVTCAQLNKSCCC